VKSVGWAEMSQKENVLRVTFYFLVAVFVLAISIIFIPIFACPIGFLIGVIGTIIMFNKKRKIL